MRKCQKVGPFYTHTSLPDGEYEGKWSGYAVELTDIQGVWFRTDVGVRGVVLVKVIIKKDEAEISPLPDRGTSDG